MKQITLTFTEQQLNTVAKALGMLPYAEVVTLIAEIQKQIKAHEESTDKNS